ncbi:MAG TPA: RNA polymerase sigma factor [Ktedonobacteraceae bacterium]|nr:RNA polymerase sigma factor [Ktedonobacteraceae bacterium]
MIATIDTIGDADVPLLVQRAQAGSMEAFDLLVRRYEGPVYRYLVSLLGNHEDASDYVQQVFFKAWLNLASLQHSAYFNVWLFSIARNLMRDHWRAKKLSCVYLEELVGDSLDLSTCGPEERTATFELMRLALAELAPNLRYCLVLRVVCGYHPCEIACMMGIRVTSVSTYISLARKQLLLIFKRLLSDE